MLGKIGGFKNEDFDPVAIGVEDNAGATFRRPPAFIDKSSEDHAFAPAAR